MAASLVKDLPIASDADTAIGYVDEVVESFVFEGTAIESIEAAHVEQDADRTSRTYSGNVKVGIFLVLLSIANQFTSGLLL